MTCLSILADVESLTTSNYILRNEKVVPKPRPTKCSLCLVIFKKAQTVDHDKAYLSEKADFITRQVRFINSLEFEVLFPEKERIRHLFFNCLSAHSYDRSEITIGGPLQRILKEERRVPDESIDPVSKKPIQATLDEADFSIRLGVQPEKIQSTNEAYYILSRQGERLGVFKPAIKKLACSDTYGAAEARHHNQSEVVASVFDQLLKLSVIPHTRTMRWILPLSKPKSAMGSFQLYVSDTATLYDRLRGENLWNPDHIALAETLDNPQNINLGLINFEEYALAELLTGNNDGHFRNILTKGTAEGLVLIGIDNGNAFPWCENNELPFYKKKPLHQYKWSTLPDALKPFSSKMVEKINGLNVSELLIVMKSQLVDKSVPSSLACLDGKIKTFSRRVKLLQSLANAHRPIRQIADNILSSS